MTEEGNVQMAPKSNRSGRTMSDDHKAALAQGREQGRMVRRYLEALEANRPKRGRKRTPDSIKKRLQTIEEKLSTADSLTRLQMIQERMDLQAELADKDEAVDLSALEADFVKAAEEYSRRKRISYAAWREMGVDAAVLKKAGVRRGAGD